MKNIYIRVSTEKQTTAAQLFAIRQYCTAHNIATDSVIEDNCSGTISPKLRNLGFLLANSKKGDLILVSEISRISRNEDDMAEVFKNARLGGYRIFAIKEGRFYGANDSGEQLGDRIMNVVDGYVSADFSKKTSQRTSEALQLRKQKIEQDGGFWSNAGRWVERLGNVRNLEEAGEKGRAANAKRWADKLANDPMARQAYAMIKLLKEKGDSNTAIVAYLSLNGFKTQSGKDFLPSGLCAYTRRCKKVFGDTI